MFPLLAPALSRPGISAVGQNVDQRQQEEEEQEETHSGASKTVPQGHPHTGFPVSKISSAILYRGEAIDRTISLRT